MFNCVILENLIKIQMYTIIEFIEKDVHTHHPHRLLYEFKYGMDSITDGIEVPRAIASYPGLRIIHKKS